jgi:hypothetical protein
MGSFRFLGFVILAAVASSRGGDGPATGSTPLQADLKKLQGTWAPVKPIQKVGYLRLEFDKGLKDGKDYLAVIHAVAGGGKMLDVGNAVVKFELKEDGKRRVIAPVTKGEGVTDIAYRFEGDTLIIEEGECIVHYQVSLKGSWKRLKGEIAP